MLASSPIHLLERYRVYRCRQVSMKEKPCSDKQVMETEYGADSKRIRGARLVCTAG